jgi:hypothetical protein
MEMYAGDNPEEFKFIRPGRPEPLPDHVLQAQWENRLLGKAKNAFMAPFLPSAEVLRKAAQIPAMLSGLKKASQGQ